MKKILNEWRKYLKEAQPVPGETSLAQLKEPGMEKYWSGGRETRDIPAGYGEEEADMVPVVATVEGTGPENYKLQSVEGETVDPLGETPTIYEMWERLSKESPWNEYTADQQAVQALGAVPGSTAREPGEVYAPKVSKGREYVIGDESQEGQQALKDLVAAYLKHENAVDETWQTVEVQIGAKPETRKPYSGEPGTPWHGATKGGYAREEEMYQLPSMYQESRKLTKRGLKKLIKEGLLKELDK